MSDSFCEHEYATPRNFSSLPHILVRRWESSRRPHVSVCEWRLCHTGRQYMKCEKSNTRSKSRVVSICKASRQSFTSALFSRSGRSEILSTPYDCGSSISSGPTVGSWKSNSTVVPKTMQESIRVHFKWQGPGPAHHVAPRQCQNQPRVGSTEETVYRITKRRSWIPPICTDLHTRRALFCKQMIV